MAKEKEKSKISNLFKRWGKFFREVFGELKKVTWPTTKELVSYTATVLAFIAVVAILIGVLDFAFSNGFKALSTLDLGAGSTPAVTASATPAATPTPAADATSTPAGTE